MKYAKKLIGDRIYLSPRSIEDIDYYYEWLNDFETTDYIATSGKLFSYEDEKKILSKEIDDNQRLFSIVLKEDDKLIGTISLKDINAINRFATLGVFIGDKDYRNDGYGTEAIKLILDYGFNYLNLHSINLVLLGCNKRAQKCYEKCGFKYTGINREARFVNGKYYDIIHMDILAEEFVGKNYIKNKNV